MNERIKELITRVGGHWNHGDFNMPSSVEFQEQDIEKFAELIVKECAQTLIDNTPVLDEYESQEDWDRGYGRAMRDCIHHIKEHFGVE